MSADSASLSSGPSGPSVSSASPAAVRVTLCPGGPMLVRGAVEVQDEDGRVHASTRPVSAICRCAATSRSPWCDGTHKLLRR